MKPIWHMLAPSLAALFAAFSMHATAQAQGVERWRFTTESLPPFVVDTKGQSSGPFRDIVQAVCDSLKASCSFDLLPWRRAYMLAESGAADGIFVLVRTAERESAFHFTDPVVQTNLALYTRQNSPLNYTRPGDLDGYTIAAYGPSGASNTMQEVAADVPNVRMELEVDNLSLLRKLAAGRYGPRGAAMINGDVANYLITRENIPGLRVAGDVRKVDYAIGLSRKRFTPAQAERFIGALRELVRAGSIKVILDKYGMKAAQ